MYSSPSEDQWREFIVCLLFFQVVTSGRAHPSDSNSDTSGETTTSDSGRGGSEDDNPSTAHTAGNYRQLVNY